WDADCALIWSVLWRGRMENNRQVYEHYRKLGKPVFILEVGSLIRGKTWKVCVNNITNDGIYANTENFIPNRAKELGLILHKPRNNKNLPILLAGQHDQSLQWTSALTCRQWVLEKIQEIRSYTDQRIHVRPHPRNKFSEITGKNIFLENPLKIPGTYDEYNLFFNYSTVVNHNSGVGLRSVWHGIPIICEQSSLATEVSIKINQITNPYIPDRVSWFEKIAHTEWTIEEISDGIPLKRLLSKMNLT
ncbi:hypothetical protein EBU71_23245, partial [bacterium]|nr:hypothetical protein [Candidatus Elulimicrobium humile]